MSGVEEPGPDTVMQLFKGKRVRILLLSSQVLEGDLILYGSDDAVVKTDHLVMIPISRITRMEELI